jgi:hypothetical protein
MSRRFFTCIALSVVSLVGVTTTAHAQGVPGDQFDSSISFFLTTDAFSAGELGIFGHNMSPVILTSKEFPRARLRREGSFNFTAERALSGGGEKIVLEFTNSPAAAPRFTVREIRSGRVVKEQTCYLEYRYDQEGGDLSVFSYGGECRGKQVSVSLAVTKKSEDLEKQACIAEGVRLATSLESAERLAAQKMTALTQTQSELVKVKSERDQAKASLNKITKAMSDSVIPYLKRVVGTVKDPNNYYRTLRNDAQGVLDSATK